MIFITVKKAQGFRKHVIGLIGAKKAEPLLLTTRFGIHTFGVNFPIDVVILDRSFRIVCAKPFLQQNRVFFWPPIYDTVIELPAGSIQKHGFKIGQTLRMVIR